MGLVRSTLFLFHRHRFGVPFLLFPGSSITRHHFSPTYPSYLPIPCQSHLSRLPGTFFDISPTFCPSNYSIPYSVQLGDSICPSQHPHVCLIQLLLLRCLHCPRLSQGFTSVVLQPCILSPQVDSSVKQNPPIHSSNLFILALLYTLSLLPSLRFKLQTG